MIRAAGMAEASQVGKGVTNGDFWAGQTAAVIRCYLHAAAIGGKTAIDLMRWARNPKAQEPITILNEHPNAADGWGERSWLSATGLPLNPQRLRKQKLPLPLVASVNEFARVSNPSS